MSERDPEVDRAAAEAVNAALYSALERGDIDAMAKLWVDGPDAPSALCIHPGWRPLHGRSEVLRAWAVIMANAGYVQVFLTDVETTVLGDAAVVTCVEDLLTDFSTADSSAFLGTRFAATNILRRTPVGWRLWVHHVSPVLSEQDLAGGHDGLGAGEGES